jgi:hypothetical protein
MASLFQGDPQKATSYTTSTSETPKWMQDAIYNQIQWSTNVAQKPFEPYSQPLVAGTTPEQQAAWQQTQQNQGTWRPNMTTAQTGTQNLAGTTSVGNINTYMNPYISNVTDRIAQLGARNLSENLLPAVSDSFVRAGQFGGTRMGEFGSRALRDTQESVLGQQAQALQQGYGQALTASQADLVRQQSALQQLAAQTSEAQKMGITDVASLEAAGQAQQAQKQRELDSAYGQYQTELNYPRQTLDWLSTQIRGMAPITPTSTSQAQETTGQTYSPSPLQQIATGLAASAGLYNMIK